jgi:16S rRNA C1402 N4-methylase RsmH
MRFDNIQEINATTYVVKDYRNAIESIKFIQGGMRASRYLAKTTAERQLIDRIIDLVETSEILLKSFPPPGTYQRIGD